MRVGKVFEDMGPRDDAKAEMVAERWIELVIEDSFDRGLDIAEYALALGHLKELLAVHIDAALADISGRRETGEAIRNASYDPAHCYPEPMGSGSQS